MGIIDIRQATMYDVPQVRLLEKELIEHERGIELPIKEGDDVYYYDIPQLINDATNSHLLVMEHDGEIIACGLGQIRENKHYYTEKYFGYVGLMSVKKEYRGRGYGRDIINLLLQWFKTKNITEVKLKVFANNPGAIKAYRKLGFEDFSIDMRVEI